MTRVKFLIFIVLIGLFSVNVNAQRRHRKDRVENLSNFDKKAIRWGFYLGLNRNNYHIKYTNFSENAIDRIEVEPEIGFNIGLIGDFRLNRNFSVRLEPGLMYNAKRLTYLYLSGDERRKRDAKGTYMHIPLLLQFSANRYKNVRPYVVGGFSYDYNFFTKTKNGVDDNSTGVFRLKNSNYMYELGIGMDFYLAWFKFSPSIRGLFAINNELQYDANPNSPWTAPIANLGTRGIFLQLNFQ